MSSALADLTGPATTTPNAAYDLVGLTTLMERTSGVETISVALLDGPLSDTVPTLENDRIRGATADPGRAGSHAVRVAGILMGSRSGASAGICPGCTLLVHPVLADHDGATAPRATHEALADAIVAAVDAGADIVNLSLGLRGRSAGGERRVDDALAHAMRHDVLVVAAAGNEARDGASIVVRHPWVLPVAGYGRDGRPLAGAQLGHSTGLRGVGAPAEDVPTVRRSGKPTTASGTSMATPVVAGTAALLWSSFPGATATDVRRALVGTVGRRRSTVPPLLSAEQAYERMGTVA